MLPMQLKTGDAWLERSRRIYRAIQSAAVVADGGEAGPEDFDAIARGFEARVLAVFGAEMRIAPGCFALWLENGIQLRYHGLHLTAHIWCPACGQELSIVLWSADDLAWLLDEALPECPRHRINEQITMGQAALAPLSA